MLYIHYIHILLYIYLYTYIHIQYISNLTNKNHIVLPQKSLKHQLPQKFPRPFLWRPTMRWVLQVLPRCDAPPKKKFRVAKMWFGLSSLSCRFYGFREQKKKGAHVIPWIWKDLLYVSFFGVDCYVWCVEMKQIHDEENVRDQLKSFQSDMQTLQFVGLTGEMMVWLFDYPLWPSICFLWYTLPPIIMVSWKMGSWKMRFVSKWAIFHFHDYGIYISWDLWTASKHGL